MHREEQIAKAATLMDTVDLSMTLSKELLRYREFAKGYYTKDGEPTKELVEMAINLKPLRNSMAEHCPESSGYLVRQFHLLKW